MSDKPKPLYAHDCDQCVFLGSYGYVGQDFDLYFCNQDRLWPTVVARYSSDGPDYESGLAAAKHIERSVEGLGSTSVNHPLVEAKRRAKERGLITRKDTRDL